MSQVILPTKLYMPRPKSRLVSRPRLLQKLDLARERKLTLISAPAGFGKTTLLGEWLQQQAERTPPLLGAWLSLDPNDNDPARFIAYLVSALKKVDPELGKDILNMVGAAPSMPVERIWEFLIGEIATVPAPFVLVLDDYHVIGNPLIHDCLAFLLDQMPAGLHLVIASRADPPLPLPRLRGRGELVELRAADLRFTSPEAAEFLLLWLGKKLSATDQAELAARTEGWIAGLQLTALAMQNLVEKDLEAGQDASLTDFIHRLNGNNRFILDYLAEEVLRSQPEAVRDFMLKTCILERLSAALCAAVTGSQDSQSILASLEKDNVFLFPLDDERNWYRYHQLFADLLLSSLQHQQPSIVSELHHKASTWYEDQGYIRDAVYHTLQTANLGEAARLMEKIALETLMGGEVDTVLNWAASIPDEQAKHRPSLCASFAWAFILSGKMEPARRYLHLFDQTDYAKDTSADCPPIEIGLARAMLSYCLEDFDNAFKYANQVGKQLSQEPTYRHGMLKFILGAAYEMIGQDQAAFESCLEAKELNHAFGNRITELFTLARIGDLHIRRGQLHQAVLSYQQALQIGQLRRDRLLPAAALPVLSMGRVLYEWNRLAEAEQYFQQSADLSQQLGNRFSWLSSLLYLARIKLIRGETDDLLHRQEEFEQVASRLPMLPAALTPILLLRLRLFLMIGDTSGAARLAQSQGQDWRLGCAYFQEIYAIFWARLWIAEGKLPDAMEALDAALIPARAARRWGSVIELLVLRTLVFLMQRQVPEALASLEEALALAEPEGYIRVFVDEGELMEQLLRQAYRNKSKAHKEFIMTLLAAFSPAGELPAKAGQGPIHPLNTKSQAALIDPLSERELEVLHMMVNGSSNQEIADRLVITVGTVKAHVSSIFSKLGVRSRTQAISKANQLQM